MSQHQMYSQFDFAGPSFDPRPFEGNNASFPQRSPRTAALVPANPRPPHELQNGTSGSNSGMGTYLGPNQPNINHLDTRNLNGFPYANGQLLRPRSSLDRRDYTPLGRFFHADDNSQPWNPHRIGNPSAPGTAISAPRPSVNFSQFGPTPGSEIASNDPRSDSGYESHRIRSIVEIDPEHNPDSQEVTYQIKDLTVNSTPTELYPPRSADQVSQYSQNTHTSQGKEFKCDQCVEVSKCRSDHKKHMLKHEKPFKCDISGCKRGGKGFTTVNDLNRHKKSVHRINAFDGSYQCASSNCRSKDKIWPRLDNFKQHVQRMHPDEDERELLRKSEYKPLPKTPIQTLSVDPMDTTLAGIGVETQFTNNAFDNSPSISLTPDQGSSAWNPFDMPSAQDFAIDVDQSAGTMYANSRMDTDPTCRQADHSEASAFGQGSASWAAGVAVKETSRLSALASVATCQPPGNQPSHSSPVLSKEPQTKAEQQKQALQNLSRLIAHNIRDSHGNDDTDLEKAVLRAIGGAAGLQKNPAGSSSQEFSRKDAAASPVPQVVPEGMENMGKTELLRGLQAWADLIKQKGRKTIGVSTHPKPFSNSTKRCNICSIDLARPCDLKKHMKRHTRPYGCTYPKCHKSFGAKSDWKRHENSQHFQLESYRCQLPLSSTKQVCGELFYRSENFKDHLKTHHLISSEDELDQEIKARRIGRNGQGQFWCGFCKDLIKLKKKRNGAWDERFNHIDDHFRAEKRIEDWLCLEAKKTKGEVLKEMDRRNFDDDGYESCPDDQDMASPLEGPNGSSDASPTSSDEATVPSPENPVLSIEMDRGKKRCADLGGEVASRRTKRARRDIVRFCCQCNHGPFPRRTYLRCMECEHEFCPHCTTTDDSGDASAVDMDLDLPVEYAREMV